MINKVLDIMDKNFMKINILNGVRKIQDVFYKENIECFAVYEEEKLVGIVTKKELVYAHPNRIVMDVMSKKYKCVDSSTYVWEIREIFNSNRDVEVIFVENKNDTIGFVTRIRLNIELGKHIDLLTGLYKSDYILYNAYNSIKSGQNTTIIFIDLNNFGYIDKKYGHINGDEVLKSVAQVLRESVNSDCYLCRYGGDEFAILTQCCIEDSKAIAEKIINTIDTFKFPNDIPVSAAIGISRCKVGNRKIENIDGLINNLVNIASLSSTKAKKNNNSIIIENVDIDEIA